jgi:hypothetical protein
MLREYPDTDSVFFGARTARPFVGQSGRWVRERETLNGEGPPGRPIYDADQTLPKLVGFLAARKGPSPEQQQTATQRVETGRLKLEAARLELDKLKGTVVPTAKAVFGHLVVHFRL